MACDLNPCGFKLSLLVVADLVPVRGLDNVTGAGLSVNDANIVGSSQVGSSTGPC
jgi:hypothetical protein